jgi:hypothetical protein
METNLVIIAAVIQNSLWTTGFVLNFRLFVQGVQILYGVLNLIKSGISRRFKTTISFSFLYVISFIIIREYLTFLQEMAFNGVLR